MPQILKATQQVVMSLQFEDAEGNAIETPSGVNAEWSVSAPEIGDLEVAPDTLTATLKAGTPSTGQVNVLIPGDDTATPPRQDILGVADVQIVAGDIATVAITFGTPSEQ